MIRLLLTLTVVLGPMTVVLLTFAIWDAVAPQSSPASPPSTHATT